MEAPGIELLKASIEVSEKSFKERQEEHENKMLDMRKNLDRLRLQQRPEYPNEDTIAGVRKLRHMTVEEYDSYNQWEQVELAENMVFRLIASTVRFSTIAPHSEVDGSKLWRFEPEEAHAIVELFEEHGIRIVDWFLYNEDTSILLRVQTPWLL